MERKKGTKKIRNEKTGKTTKNQGEHKKKKGKQKKGKWKKGEVQ